MKNRISCISAFVFSFVMLFWVPMEALSHGMHMAIFEISQTEEGCSLNISFDKEDLVKSLLTNYPDLSGKQDIASMRSHIVAYLNSNFQLRFNTQCIDVDVTDILYAKNYVRIKASLLTEVNEMIRSVSVFNTCLIDYTEGHTNVVRAHLNGRFRSFKLDRERTSTFIDYNDF